MEAIVLAGGFGTRLRSVINDVPKPMAPINNIPFLEVLLATLESKGFSRIVLSVGYMADAITEYFGSCYNGMKIDYAIENEPLGTGGAVKLAMQYISSEYVFIFNGDTFVDIEVESLELLWKKVESPIIVGKSIDDTSRYGRLLIENDILKGFTEKGVSGEGVINAGCYVLSSDILNRFPLGINFSLEQDFIVKYIENLNFHIFLTKGLFIDIGIPEDYRRAQTELIKFIP